MKSIFAVLAVLLAAQQAYAHDDHPMEGDTYEGHSGTSYGKNDHPYGKSLGYTKEDYQPAQAVAKRHYKLGHNNNPKPRMHAAPENMNEYFEGHEMFQRRKEMHDRWQAMSMEERKQWMEDNPKAAARMKEKKRMMKKRWYEMNDAEKADWKSKHPGAVEHLEGMHRKKEHAPGMIEE